MIIIRQYPSYLLFYAFTYNLYAFVNSQLTAVKNKMVF